MPCQTGACETAARSELPLDALHVELLHEHHAHRGGVNRTLYYVEAMALLRFKPTSRKALRKEWRDESAFREALQEHAHELQ